MTHQYVTKLVKLSNGDDVVGEVDIASLRTVSYTHLTLPTTVFV